MSLDWTRFMSQLLLKAHRICLLHTNRLISQSLEKLNMNRTEAKAYALHGLGLDRDAVRQFGNLSRTQTWLDAIAAAIAVAETDSVEPAATNPAGVETALTA